MSERRYSSKVGEMDRAEGRGQRAEGRGDGGSDRGGLTR